MYFKTIEKKECSGCTACMNACPVNAIFMKQDEEGFFYPEIEKDLCIRCGICEKKCPFEHPKYENTEVQEVYASYVKDINQRQKSTSGGVFYAISKWIIDRGGIVYGAAFDENFKLLHVGVNNLLDLEKLRGSKYLQSYLGTVFQEIKEHLKAGRWVYFVGCGCQVSGLNAFLKKKYEKLITSDLVCHGVPSQLMFDWHIDYLRKKEKGKINSYSFRNMTGWGVCESYEYDSQVRKKKGNKVLSNYFLSPYLYSFMWAYSYRYSCYECRYAQIPRQGDITLADYWGVSHFFPELDTTKGVSLTLVNTQQGHFMWNNIKENLEYRISNVKDAAKENKNLVCKTVMPIIRPVCYQIIKNRGYEDVAKHEFRIKKYWLYLLIEQIRSSAISKWLCNVKYHVKKR